MSVEEVRGEVERRGLLYRVAPLIGLTGLMVVIVTLIVGLVRSGTIADYYASDKAARDGAEAGSALLANLEFINAIQAWLLPLEFLGISALLVGIALLFSTIMGRIRLRAAAMAQVLPALIQQSDRKK